jgi:hypothetical protein
VWRSLIPPRGTTGQPALLPPEAGQGAFFPPEVLDDVRGVCRRLIPRRRSIAEDSIDETGRLVWLWLLLFLYPFTDYPYTWLVNWGVPDLIAAGAFVVLDTGIIVAVLLSRGDAAGARFFGALAGVTDLTYAATQLLRNGTVYEELLYDVLYTILLIWVLAHIFRTERVGRLLTAPIVIGAFVGYLGYTIPAFLSNTELDRLLKGPNGVTYYSAAASVIPVFLIALSLEGGWLDDAEGDSPLARSLRHGLRLVTILILAVAQAAAVGAMLSGGGSLLAYQITVEAMGVGFTAIFIMLYVQSQH